MAEIPPIEWLAPWHSADEEEGDDDYRAAWEEELALECSPEHQLYGLSVRMLGQRRGCDTAVFALADGRVAQVHLTWIEDMETDPRFPASGIYDSVQQWIDEEMIPDHKDWAKLNRKDAGSDEER